MVTHYFQNVCKHSITLSCMSVGDQAHFLFSAEELLNNFAQQNGAWRHCLFFLSNTRNEYVMMYSLTVFEVSLVGGRFSVHRTVFFVFFTFFMLSKYKEKHGFWGLNTWSGKDAVFLFPRFFYFAKPIMQLTNCTG